MLLGIVAGAALASLVGRIRPNSVRRIVDIVTPLRHPPFHLAPIPTMRIVMAVVMIEAVGMFLRW